MLVNVHEENFLMHALSSIKKNHID